ncbi:hypothetical protein [Lysobacter capsici]|uniref:hypothetical protein n=1 Tax=Lysobacter capsici TaxID=435897 RepID=UPI00287B87AB|nr:hypothetical protein [Lysobacter capsici]WND80130.1 hypothetical protein RJ610_23095 [Lysobacter capsici]WND85326.1 hypothetical protein RJ609_23110 [Lysobacter capsici]
MNENSAIQARLPQTALTDAGGIETGLSQDGLARCGERELGLLRGSRDDAATRMPSHGGADPGLGGGLSPDERALLLAAFGIDARTRPLSLLAVDFIRTRRRLRDARPQTAEATC